MTQAHPCLLSIGKVSSKYRHFPFLEDQIKIGRSSDVTYTILSNTISRCHAIIEKQGDNIWTITDNKSLNGISVNNTPLKPLQPYTLREGDVVQLGITKDADSPAEFVYRFFFSLKLRREPKASKQQNSASGSSSAKHLLTVPDQNAGRSRKRKGQAAAEDEDEEEEEDEDKIPQENKRLKTNLEGQLQALSRRLQEKERENAAVTQQLQKERQERQAGEKRQREQEKKVSQMGAKQKQLMKEQAAAEAQVRKQLEDQLREREERVRRQMQRKLEALTSEKRQVEQHLHKEMEKAVREMGEEVQNRLQEERDRLQKVIETKELEQKALESELAESREEKERAKADTLTTREAILSEFADTMETELQCSICSELFVKATSLNCSHAFCALCIRQWLAVKNECPNCRTTVTSQIQSIVLDSYIDRMVEQLSGEMKERRAVLVAERKEAEAKLEEADNEERVGPSGSNTGQQRRGRGRGRGRGGRGRGGRAATRRATPGPPEVVATVTHESGEESSSNDDEAGVAERNSSESILDSDDVTDSDDDEAEVGTTRRYRTNRSETPTTVWIFPYMRVLAIGGGSPQNQGQRRILWMRTVMREVTTVGLGDASPVVGKATGQASAQVEGMGRPSIQLLRL
ncbi:hypothetical protein ACOMHN_006472 [Nucella lapillus]